MERCSKQDSMDLKFITSGSYYGKGKGKADSRFQIPDSRNYLSVGHWSLSFGLIFIPFIPFIPVKKKVHQFTVIPFTVHGSLIIAAAFSSPDTNVMVKDNVS